MGKLVTAVLVVIGCIIVGVAFYKLIEILDKTERKREEDRNEKE